MFLSLEIKHLVYSQILRLARGLGDFLLVGIHTDQTVTYETMASLCICVCLVCGFNVKLNIREKLKKTLIY